MLARSGPIPTRGDWAFEVKWDGFRAIVSTEGTLRVRSPARLGNMTDLVPEPSADLGQRSSSRSSGGRLASVFLFLVSCDGGRI
jgi:ATP-dependent DNA ligase